MAKGSKTQTVQTQTVNPMQQAQMPFVTQGWDTAKALYDRQQQYPGSTIADWGIPWQKEGYNNIYATGHALDETMRPQANAYWQQAGDSNVYNSPAYQTYQNFTRPAGTPETQWLTEVGALQRNGAERWSNQIAGYGPQIAGYAGQAGANNNLGLSTLGQVAQGQGTGMEQLAASARGDYINGNPWFSQMVQNAMDPITRNYQTAVAPQLDATFMNSGRYGSGAMLGARENANTTLADQLAKTSSGMYGQNYANERQQQLQAANQYAGLQNQAGGTYGQLYNQGLGAAMTGLAGAAGTQQAAAQAYQQGLAQDAATLGQRINAQLAGAQGLQGAYQSGAANAAQAAANYPALAQAQFAQARAALEAGSGINAIQQQYIDEPYNMLDRYLKQIGAVQSGSSTTNSPYFTNPMANTMAGITGGLDIMQKMGGMGGLGGSSGGYPATVNSPSGTWVNGTGMGSGIYTNMSNGYTSDQAGSGFPGIGQAVGIGSSLFGGGGGLLGGIGSLFTGGWIICTELLRQKRMPWRHWAIGTKAFGDYPEVVQRGYYVWAVPVVRHLQRKPDSLLSRFTGAAFRWRAEDLAARHGLKGARKLLRGRMVTWALYPICAAIGSLVPANWQQAYRDDLASA